MAVDVTALLHGALLCAAFWTAVSLYRGVRALRFLAGLGLGAVFAHLGWALLHASALARHPAALLDPALGYCVLFFPLGPLLLAPEAATWRALPLALAVARLGCLSAGCCHGVASAWGTHPTPLYEMVLLLGLHLGLRASSDARAASVFFAGFGLERLVVAPFRAPPPLGTTTLDPALLAGFWVAAGVLALPSWRRAQFASARLGVRTRVAGLAVGAALLLAGVAELAPGSGTSQAPAPVESGVAAKNHPAARGRAAPAPSAAAVVLPPGRPRAAPPGYRRALASRRPAERRAALDANALLWDHAALPLLVALEDDPSPRIREAARRLVRRYLVWGPTRPSWQQRRDANRPDFEPFDRAGLRAWRARGR